MSLPKSEQSPDFFENPTNSIGYLARVTFRAFARALEKRILPYGVSSGQWRFLRVLWSEDGITQRELSRRVGMREPTTVIALKSLERTGLVRRAKSEEDRRKVHVFLTAKARRLKPKLMPFVAEVNARATDGIPAADIRTVRRVLLQISRNLAAEAAEMNDRDEESSA